MIRMSSNLKTMILIATFALLAFAAVSASAQQKAKITVPFAFVANQVSLPAGHYEVLAANSHVILISLESNKEPTMLLTMNDQGSVIDALGSMKFRRAGNRYILTEIRFAGSSNRRQLLRQPKQERLIATNPSSKPGAIEIAMN
jgi:hypothetical protein